MWLLRCEISCDRQSGYHDDRNDDGKSGTAKLIEDDLSEQDGDEGEGRDPDEIEGEVVVLNGIAERSSGDHFPAVGGEVDQQSKIEEAIGATIKRSSGHRVTLLK